MIITAKAMTLVSFAALVLLSVGVGAASPRDLADDADKYLLPWNIRPEHYDLTLFTNIDKFNIADESSFRYSGINEITFIVLYGDVSEIVLHTYDDMSILSAQVDSLNPGGPLNYSVSIGNYDPETNKQTFKVSPPLSNNGRYRAVIYFSAQNSDRLRGFYRSSYYDNGTTRWLITTHFESFGAREAFPSFDEPEYKATYKLTVLYNQTLANLGYRAFFNTEVESEEVLNGVHITTFKKTPRPLSTYLVAFIVAPFSVSPAPAHFNSSFNGENAIKPLWTIGQPKYFSPKRQDLLSQVAAPAALNQMTKFTNVGFGMDKVEQAGIPDFGPGAMENWGLVTYRESAVFWDNETGTTAQKQGVVSTTTHELAHQWFGDLVTLHWWTDLWLNEGFATFFATHAANEFREPDLDTSDWNLIGKFVTGTLQSGALKTDGLPSSRPMTAEAYRPDVIDRYFDGISYDKGGSVLRMWMHILGADIFYAGLNRYLRQQEESVGTPEILLASWDGAIDLLPENERPDLLGRSAADLFAGWHRQPGYPVVTVARSEATLTLSQERFLSAPGTAEGAWNVPITYSSNLESNFNSTAPVSLLLANDPSASLTIKNGAADWIVVNNQQTGFYRVNYDSANWAKLLAVLNDPEQADRIHEFNRAQILDDSNALAASTHKQYLSYSIALKMLETVKHDESDVVWATALRIMDDLIDHFKKNPAFKDTYSMLKEFFMELVEPMFLKLTLYTQETDSHARKILRSKISAFACELGLPACTKQAKEISAGSVHPDVRNVVLCEVVKQGGDAEWQESLTQALMPVSPVQYDHLMALSCTENEAHLNQLFDILLSKDKMTREADVLNLLKVLLRKHPSQSNKVLDVLHVFKFKGEVAQPLKVTAMTILMYNGINFEKDKSVMQTLDKNLESENLWISTKGEEIRNWLSNQRSH